MGFNVEMVEYKIKVLFFFLRTKIRSLLELQIPEYIMSIFRVDSKDWEELRGHYKNISG